MTELVMDALVKNIRRRMIPQPLKIWADTNLKCFQFDGVLHIKVIQLLELYLDFWISTLLILLLLCVGRRYYGSLWNFGLCKFENRILYYSSHCHNVLLISSILFVSYLFVCLFQDAMRKVEAVGTEQCPVKIKLVVPPFMLLVLKLLIRFEYFYIL